MKKFIALLLICAVTVMCAGCTPIRLLMNAILPADPTEAPEIAATEPPSAEAVEPEIPAEPEVTEAPEPEVTEAPEPEVTEAPEPEVTQEPTAEPQPEDLPADVPATLYQPAIADFEAEFIDFGSKVYAPGHYTDAYLYDGMVYIQLGRFPDIAGESAAFDRVCELTGANRKDISTIERTVDGFPALLLHYSAGQNEDTKLCYDIVVFAPDAVHWLHTATPADWFEDYGEVLTEFLGGMYLMEMNEENYSD